MSRESARDYLFNQRVRADSPDRFACSQPVEVPAIGLPSQFEPKGSLTLTLFSRCRKCPECLEHRRRLWTARAVDEIKAAQRTWFGTLTVSPDNRFRIMLQAERERLRAGRETYGQLEASEQFRLFAGALNRDVTKFLKRCRAIAPGHLRYLLVMEAHKDGFPHAHILIHEVGEPITKRRLEDQWRLGFSHWRLVGDSPQAATYVCKYLNKSALTRVRASQRYGRGGQADALTERLSAATHVLQACSVEGTRERETEGMDPPASGGREGKRENESSSGLPPEGGKVA